MVGMGVDPHRDRLTVVVDREAEDRPVIGLSDLRGGGKETRLVDGMKLTGGPVEQDGVVHRGEDRATTPPTEGQEALELGPLPQRCPFRQ